MNMDKALKRLTLVGMLLIFALMVNINYIQGSEADALKKNKKNARQYADIFTRDRGAILADGTKLAESFKIGGDRGKKYARKYNGGAAFSPVTGYFMPSGAKGGLELADDSLLDGVDKRISVRSWFDAFVGTKPKGANVYTTINSKAQRSAYSILKAGTDRRAGAAVIDVKTGAIVVLASTPSFDFNTIAGQQDGTQANQKFVEEQKQRFNPTVDKAMSDRFPPGSSFKIVVAAAELDSGQLNSQSTVDTADLILPESGRKLPNDPGAACAGQPTALIMAFANSCNSTFGRFALQLGAPALNAQAAKFGFNTPIAVETDLKSATSSLTVPGKDPTKITGDALGRSGIGQENVGATPLQMAMVASAVANNGKLMKPYLVDKVVTPDNQELYNANPAELPQPIKSSTAQQLQDMMRAVVAQGTAKNLQGKNVAGKTGTAELGLGTINDRWFVGFSPAQNPRYAFAVMTEGPGFGATAAGEQAAQIMQAVLQK
ncbi:MAG: penicillin-binding protein [Streptosporangiaceae bacterium]|jgi:cell division protein FtsI/penicillin-binding protein 2|nr:penicillin-binding protein transpeptidase [Streptosporangiaceae bacterium]MDX6432298.1 penicillin-binding protein [Streptosporangiaceae bacterium]